MVSKKTIKTQSELDKIPFNYEGEIVIIGGTVDNPITLTKRYENAYVILSGNSVVIMRESSQVNVMRGSSQVKEMRESSQVKEMRESSQVNVMRESSQVNVMWESSQVKEMWGSSQVKEMRESSQVKEMWGSSQVKEMRGSSQVKEMRESSQVNVMRESSQVNVMWESSQVNVMRESSQVNVMRGSSQVKEMWGSSQVKEMRGTAIVRSKGKNMINCYGFNYVFLEKGADTSIITLNETSQILHFDSFNTKPDIEFYLANYPINKKDDETLIMYKAVRKNKNGEYVSNYDSSFKYLIGETKTHPVSSNIDDSCSFGLHVGHLQFATGFGRDWTDLAILELEVPKDKIVVSRDCDGKVRTSDLRVIRELDKTEYQHLL